MTEIKQAEGQHQDEHLNPDKSGSSWVRIGLFSLLIVAVLNGVARVLHVQSPITFVAWLTQILMTLMLQYLAQRSENNAVWKKYNWLLWTNLLSAVGMLISFLMDGYGVVYIIFSIFSTVVSYAFTGMYWLDLNRLPKRLISHLWFKAALIWNVVSSIGTFTLAYMRVEQINDGMRSMAAHSFFQHFQYNGWFLFACGGLLYSGNTGDTKMSRNVFYTLLLSCAPAYFLSVLWEHVPTGTYIIAGLAAIVQLMAWAMLLSQIASRGINLIVSMRSTVRVLMIIAAVAGSLKFLWQLACVHPAVERIAVGFPSVEIAYDQLFLLGMLSIFIIAYLIQSGSIAPGDWRTKGVAIFMVGLILEEILLLSKAIVEINQNEISFINQSLFVSDFIILIGVALLNVGMMKSEK